MTDMTPERIYLVRAEDDSGPVWAWCEDPAPGTGMETADAVEYVRADALSRPADTEASRTLDALIALAAGDDGLPDDMRADVERLRARLFRPAVPELLDADKVHAEKEALDVQFKTPYMHTLRWVQGWNSCREAMLAAAPEPAEGNHFRDAPKMAERAWIAVSERLPEEGQCVLLACEYADAPVVGYQKHGLWWADTEHHEVSCAPYCYGGKVIGCLKDSRVTHWMPLPAPPSAEGDSE